MRRSRLRQRESGARHLAGDFRGRFAGPGKDQSFIELAVRSAPLGPTSVLTGLQAIVGVVPATCVKNGRTLVGGRDGAIGIHFSSLHSGLRARPRVKLGADGIFAFRLEHKADVLNNESYSASKRGTFTRKAVAGPVQGTSVSDFFGKCRANRTFTARITAG